MAHVFIAYKHSDSDFAYILRQQLENAGFQVWMDEDLQAGEDWRQEIDLAIRTCFALIVIMTPEARQSEYVTYEWACAWGAEKPVIPILRETTDLHPRLEALQYMKFTHSDRRDWPWDRLIARLRKEEEQSSMTNVPRDAPVAVKRAVIALDSHRSDERIAALNTLAQTNHPSGYEALVAALQHHVRDVRNEAVFLLKEVDGCDARAVPGLIEAFHDPKANVRRAAAAALGKIGDARAVPSLIKVLHDWESVVREAAVMALGEIGDASAVPELLKALHDESEDVRSLVVMALGFIHDVAVVPGLLEVLRDKDEGMRKTASEALAWVSDVSMPSLLNALHDENQFTRDGAEQAFGWMWVQDVPRLVEILLGGVEKGKVCEIVAGRLERIAKALSRDEEQPQRKQALEAVEKWRREQGQNAD